MQKRGQVSQQFNWIFAAVAGGVILLLFLFVIGQIKASGDAKLGVTILEQMDAVLTGSESTDNAVTKIPINNLFSMTLTCDEDSTLQIANTASSMDTKTRFLYAPYEVGSKEIYVATKELYRPFYLGNAVLLSDEQIMFFVFSPPTADAQNQQFLTTVFDNLPNNISKSYQAYFLEVFRQYDHVVTISTAPPPTFQSSELYSGVNILRKKSATWIELSLSDIDSATIYVKDRSASQFDSGTQVSVPKPELYTLLAYSKNAKFYNCGYDKLNSKLSIVTKIYRERLNLLQQSDEVPANCRSRYITAINLLDDLERSTIPYEETSTINEIKTINQNLLLLSCPVIY